MSKETRDAAAFYATPLGRLTAGVLRQQLLALWPNCANLAVLGLGYTVPYLQLWRPQAARAVAVTAHPHFPAEPWPPGQKNLVCAAEEDALPFPDLSFDRILIVHGLEQADNARKTLREAWRLLADDGRLIIAVPNRRGMWAHAENTPFGHGQPYSQSQLARLLQNLFFCVESQHAALYAPPLTWRPALRAFPFWERFGAFAPQFAGLTIVEATKDIHGVIPLQKQRVGRRVLVEGVR
jgi:SAM-dependent methyltransferase